MSTATPARKPAAAAPTTPSGSLRKPPSSQQTTPGRSTSPAKQNGSPQVLSGIARSPSTRATAQGTRPVRAGTRRTGSVAGASGQSAADLAKEEDAKAENAALIDGLKESVRNAENTSDDYQKQLAQMQHRVDELLEEHSKMEERLQETLEKNEELQMEKKEATRELREAGNIYESEKAAMMKDREESSIREDDLRDTIQSLKDKLIGRDARTDEERAGRPATRDESSESESHFAPSAAISKLSPQRSDSKSTSRLVMQKDQLIESLRLELAEAQIKLVEMENQGGGRMAELEKTLLETRMTNARLMEDNESYQLLLGEKTMNGELAKSEVMQHHAHHGSTSGMGSLAEELASVENNDDKVAKLQERVKSLEDQNKALTLYIDRMLTKIMSTADQMALLDKDGSTEKLPSPLHPPRDMGHEQQSVAQNMMAGISRSLSVFNKRQRPSSMMSFTSQTGTDDGLSQTSHRSRPSSGIIAPAPTSEARFSAVSNPLTAPSIPLGRSTSVQMRNRGHRRTQSSQSAVSGGPVETGSSLTIGTTGPAGPLQRQLSGSRSPGLNTVTSPGIPSGPSTPRFPLAAGVRAPSSSGTTPANSSIAEEGSQATTTTTTTASTSSQRMSGSVGSFASNENASIEAGGKEPGASSPPRNAGGQTNYTGAVMTQNKLRPLRLVQQEKEEREAEEQARKKANRASWMGGWFNRGAEGGPGPHPQTINEQAST